MPLVSACLVSSSYLIYTLGLTCSSTTCSSRAVHSGLHHEALPLRRVKDETFTVQSHSHRFVCDDVSAPLGLAVCARAWWCSGRVWAVHGGEDAHHLGPLCGGDVLRHVHDGVHGHFGVCLNQTEQRTEREREQNNNNKKTH